MKEQITSLHAPAATGPYSQAIREGDALYLSGQLPIDAATGEFASESITDQTEQVILNLRAILHEAGCDLADVVKTTVYLRDMSDFAAMNQVYQTYFRNPYPARAAFEVSGLLKNALVEIDAVAYKK